MTTASQEYMPESSWPGTALMLEGFGEPSLAATKDLVGTSWPVEWDEAPAEMLTFTSESEVQIEAGGATRPVRYRAVQVRPQVFYVDLLDGSGTLQQNVSYIAHLGDRRVTRASSHFVDRHGEVRTGTRFDHGRLAGSGAPARSRTDALVGKRIFYRYSATEAYEHIYLNAGTFVWHCVRGGEQGLADVDRAEAYELDDELVILYWQENVMAVESVLVVDLRQQRSIGRMFCWDAPTLSPIHIPFDSRFTVLNETHYPTDQK